MSPSPVSEEELHAYFDGQLEAWRHAEVRALLDASPAVAARLAAWRRDSEGLRAALAGIETWTPNPSLDPAVIRRRMRNRSVQALARTVGVSVALGAAALVGWWMRGGDARPAPAPPMQDAVDAYRAFAVPRAPAMEQSAHRGSLSGWLGNALGLAHRVALPDLSERGLHPAGGRLLATSEGVGAMVLYEPDSEADSGPRISYYLRPARHFISGTRGWTVQGGLAVRYWYQDGYGYALIGQAADPRTREIERGFP